MKLYIQERTLELAKHIVATKCTMADCARKFGISISTVNSDLNTRLVHLDKKLYVEVRKVLTLNKAEAHLRGGLATKEKHYVEPVHRYYTSGGY